MKAILLAVCLTLVAAEAQAVSRYISTSMSCAQVQGAVRGEGVAILRWASPTSGVPRYDRYVRNDRFCPSGQEARRAYVPTADARSCPVYNCKQIERDRFFFKRRLFPHN
ncbi:hypothetical protein ASC75_02750 [Aminobacter sp. DSM 101952]|uniref:hypothetical protein n=1 Tax=Aminobacter sp. DSM 101952 TaxID=2735891 RepID=UPI0007022F2C|nr:hypothetical protein [Aminobacter sp. DSM 101952]KQU76547.1 hypothetical protein ASC75_02750 [Aminobacter sp. DSM 101952]